MQLPSSVFTEVVTAVSDSELLFAAGGSYANGARPLYQNAASQANLKRCQ